MPESIVNVGDKTISKTNEAPSWQKFSLSEEVYINTCTGNYLAKVKLYKGNEGDQSNLGRAIGKISPRKSHLNDLYTET